MSFDLGHIELGDSVNLDKVSFDRIRREAVAQYERGGMVSFSWHLDNPLTGKDTWDVSDSTVVSSVLPGGANHEKFITWLDRAADYMNSIRTADGTTSARGTNTPEAGSGGDRSFALPKNIRRCGASPTTG